MDDRNKKILALLDKYGTDVKRALKENKKLEYLYALAELRENLLEWFEFKKEGRILQAGADFGALTGLFADRTAFVTVLDPLEENLEVVRARYCGRKNIEYLCGCLTGYADEIEAQVPALYDYVTVIGTLRPEETVEAQIEAAKRLLAPGGVLIFAACNRFGMKYFAGARRDEVTVTKRELLTLFPRGDFYYPMPDYKLPNEIYSDRYLPKKGDLSGALPVYDYPKYLLMDVGASYDAVCEDGQFDNFANSFLVVWEKEAEARGSVVPLQACEP